MAISLPFVFAQILCTFDGHLSGNAFLLRFGSTIVKFMASGTGRGAISGSGCTGTIGAVVDGIAVNPKSKDLMNNFAFSFVVGWPEMK